MVRLEYQCILNLIFLNWMWVWSRNCNIVIFSIMVNIRAYLYHGVQINFNGQFKTTQNWEDSLNLCTCSTSPK